ncbi:unnamed protein product, partial [Didymodactylos carnosus]
THHWHLVKPCGTETERIKDDMNKKAKKYRYRTTVNQNFLDYFTAYGKSLTSFDIKDNQLKIALPQKVLLANEFILKQKHEKEVKQSANKQKILAVNDKYTEDKKKQEELQRMSNIEKTLKSKTYASYYAMKEVLKGSYNGLCIYVSPTNALERLADLNKYLYSGKALHPIHLIGLMNSKQLIEIERGSLPVDLSLSPKETLQLYDAAFLTIHSHT